MLYWYSNIKEDDKLFLPKEINHDKRYKNELNDMINYFIRKISTVSLPDHALAVVKLIGKLLIGENRNYKGIVDLYYDGKISEAIKRVEKILEIYLEYPLSVSILDNSFAFKRFVPCLDDDDPYKLQCNDKPLVFFKARLSEGITNYSATDMFHLPFDDRYKIYSQRFSLAGIPCLYLGTTPYICWLELGKPARDNFNVAAFELDRCFKILNLYCTWSLICSIANQENGNKNMEEFLLGLILLWPLVCATSFRVKNGDGNKRIFRPEYIISQLLMLAIQSKAIDGIGYVSKKIPLDANPFPHCMNLVLTVKYNDSENYSEIYKKIRIHRPVNMGEFTFLPNLAIHRSSYTSSFIESGNFIENNIFLDQKFHRYVDTDFFRFDKYLRAENEMEINTEGDKSGA